MIDKAIILTTSKDADFIRNKTSHVEQALGLPAGFVEVMQNTPDSENRVRGCFMAHQGAYDHFVETGKETCLILEDDVYFTKKFDLSTLDPIMANEDWDLIYLGHRPVLNQDTFVRKSPYKGFVQVKTNDRHAMIMSRKFALKTQEITWWGKNGDVLLRNNSKNCFAPMPMVAIQLGAPFGKSFNNGLDEKLNQYLQRSKMGGMFTFLAALVGLPLLLIYWVVYHSMLSTKL